MNRGDTPRTITHTIRRPRRRLIVVQRRAFIHPTIARTIRGGGTSTAKPCASPNSAHGTTYMNAGAAVPEPKPPSHAEAHPEPRQRERRSNERGHLRLGPT